MTTPSFPGPGGDILEPGAAERIVEKVVTRHYLYQPKDEEPPLGADGKPTGENWFEHNYRPRPSMMAPKLQIDPKPFCDSIAELVNAGKFEDIVKRCQQARIQVVTAKGAPIVTIRIIP